MDPQEFSQQSKERQKWVAADPNTLVAAAKKAIYSGPLQGQQEVLGPLEEVIARFEHQTRAALGSQIQVGSS